jgi:hypothetical protein
LGERSGFGASFDREEAGMSGSTVDLELLATGTSLNELVYEVGESGPEIVPLDGDSGGLLSRVSGGGEIVILSRDFSAEVDDIGNVSGSPVGEDRSFLGG